MDWIGLGFLLLVAVMFIAVVNDRTQFTPPPEPSDRARYEAEKAYVEDNHSTKRNSFD